MYGFERFCPVTPNLMTLPTFLNFQTVISIIKFLCSMQIYLWRLETNLQNITHYSSISPWWYNPVFFFSALKLWTSKRPSTHQQRRVFKTVTAAFSISHNDDVTLTKMFTMMMKVVLLYCLKYSCHAKYASDHRSLKPLHFSQYCLSYLVEKPTVNVRGSTLSPCC